MAQAIFDIAEKLDLYFRIARVGSKTFTFKNVDLSAYSLSGTSFQLNIKTDSRASTNVLQLTPGAGLTIVSNVLTVAITEVQSALSERMYYWELYDATGKKTWLCGNAYFISKEPFDGSDSTSVTVNLIPDSVTLTISNSAGSSDVNGGTP